MRIVTVEEHFEHPDVSERVMALSGPPDGLPIEELAAFGAVFNDDRGAATRLSGRRLAHMDAVGIDMQVVSHGNGSPSSLPHGESLQLCRDVNDDLAQQIADHPDRFRGFATLPLYDPGAAAEEFRRCVGDLGFVGALIAGSFDGLFLDDLRFDPILATAAALDLPVYVHPGLPHPQVGRPYYFGDWPAAVGLMFSGPAFGWHAEAGVHVLRLILSGALDRHRGLKLLSGHWGELMVFWLDRLDETFALVRGTSSRPISDYYREQIWITPSGMFDQRQLDQAVGALGADRIVYSEDYPYVQRDNVSEFLSTCGLAEPQREAIAHTNVEALLHL